MIAPRVLDVSDLPGESISSEAPLWRGQLLLTFIEGTMFAVLIAMYFYYRSTVDVWPPPGTRMPSQLLPALSLLLLIVSCLDSYRASEAAKRDEPRGMVLWLGFNVLFGLAAMVVRAVSWASFNFTQAADVHGSVVWTILGLHSLDAVADLLFTIALIVAILRGHRGPPQRLGVHVDSVVWYFVVLIWIPLYVVVYWGRRW